MAEPAEAASKAGSIASKKIGPLPAGVWLIVLGGTIVIVYAVNSRGGGKSTGATLAVADDGTTGADTQSGIGAGGWSYSAPAPVTPAKTFDTNEEWGRAAIQFLIGQGYDAALADIAIRRYLGGLDISAQQRPLITAAIAGLGPVPNQLGPINELPGDTPVTGTGGGNSNTPQPAPVQRSSGIFGLFSDILDVFLPGLSFSGSGYKVPVGPDTWTVGLGYDSAGGSLNVKGPQGDTTQIGVPRNPALVTPVAQTPGRKYTVVQGDTLASIALTVYGSSLQASKIYNANLGVITDKDNLTPGAVLTIPE